MNNIYNNLLSRSKSLLQEISDVSTLTESTWNQVDENGICNVKYIFKKTDNELIISKQGDANVFKWEYVRVAQSILIRQNNKLLLYNNAFISKEFIVLKKDSIDEYLILVCNEYLNQLLGEHNLLSDNNLSSYESEKVVVNPKSNNTSIRARKEREAMGFGIIIGLVMFLIIFLVKTEVIELTDASYRIMAIAAFAIRMLVVSWIIGIARRLKRNSLFWGLFGFFVPVLALIIIGNLSDKK